ncbi:MAG: acetate kinase [Kocuria rhizophila]|mgnify:CR=1 FL=1|uniref:acetate/propionate family kinase n=1 Tax=Kocuria TaxID=57493 RepID=UPI000DB67D17|nr:acetate kinase [Kocuria carniphila]PZP29495.1 MAG: acetate kinase [Kocuria rhizophila]
MLVLVVNCGSSSIKYQVREVTTADEPTNPYTSSMPAINENVPLARATEGVETDEIVTKGLIQNIGTSEIKDHTQALEILAERLDEELGGRTIDAAGHRVVHGGERFSAPVLVNNEIIRAIERLAPLAPLHNPASALGLRAIQKTWPHMPQVCVFDTAFHRTMPEKAWRYAIPEEMYVMHGMRRYGFHGTSHDYVTGKACDVLGIPREQFNGIVAHLGNGASVTAIRNGESFDTSMGYTPLAGLIMGTRSGDLDPSVVTAMLDRNPAMTAKELDRILNKESGLQGISGDSDMRAVEQRAANGDEKAQLALDMAAYRLAKYIGGYHVAVGGAQALIFTAGIGENSPEFRTRVCNELGALGIALDPELNASPEGDVARISTSESAIEVLVISTDEERAIAEATAALVRERVKK